MSQSFVVTGASGFIGSQLVPRLKTLGCELLLVGRDTRSLDHMFPDIPTCSYDELAQRAQGFDALIHLAVLNNNVSASAEEFNSVNVGLLSHVISATKTAGIAHFVNITSFHAIDGSRSAYANSKRRALNVLEEERELSVINVFLPAVYGDHFAGRLSIVEKFPPLIRPAALVVLTALVPTLHIDRLVAFIASEMGLVSGEILLSHPQDQNPVYRLGKRAMDVLFCLAIIGFLWWLLVAIWLLVRMSSKGPGLFAQERIGRDGKSFTCYKFRTMKQGTKQAGTHEVSADAVTAIGGWLRKTKIDELPQIWNILRGHLSLVGPRPCLPSQMELIMARQHLGVQLVLPGITGLAQINGVDMSDPIQLAKVDQCYIARRGLFLDIEIILRTMLGHGQGDQIKR